MQPILATKNEKILKFKKFGIEPMQGPEPFYRFAISATNRLSTANASNLDYFYIFH